MGEISIELLNQALERAWNPATGADPEHWSPDNSAWGQCAVTALVVQDYFGGELLRVQASGLGFNWGHYFNRLPSGLVVDFTHRQFPLGTDFAQLQVRERSALLDPKVNPANVETAYRYEQLSLAVGGNLRSLTNAPPTYAGWGW